MRFEYGVGSLCPRFFCRSNQAGRRTLYNSVVSVVTALFFLNMGSMPLRVITCMLLGVIAQADTSSQQPKTTTIAGSQVDIDIYGNIFALDEGRNTLTLFSDDYVKLRDVGGPGWEDDQFDLPRGLWARNGIDVFVADYGNHRIQRFDRNLNFVSSLFTRDNTNPEERFGYPTDVALSRLDRPSGYFIAATENDNDRRKSS